MRLRNLFTPSFRNRLRLFFMVIVVVPMIAVALVLFQIVTRSEETQTDAQLSEAQRVAANLYRASANRANAAGQEIVDDDGLSEAIDTAGGGGFDFYDPWGNRIEVVEYGEIQFERTPGVKRKLGIESLGKSEAAHRQIDERGLA